MSPPTDFPIFRAPPRHNVPLYALIAFAVMLTAILALVLSGHAEHIGVVVTTIVAALPAVVASLFAERTSRDVRNGVVAQQARTGAVKALEDTGVTDVVAVSQRGQSTLVALQALQRLLEDREIAENKAASERKVADVTEQTNQERKET